MRGDGMNAGRDAGMDAEGERLHVVMAQATQGLTGVRIDTGRMLRARRRRRWQEGGAAVGLLAVAVAGFTLRDGDGKGGSAVMPVGPATSAASQPGPAFPTTPANATVTPVAVEVYDAVEGTEGKETLQAFEKRRGPWLTRAYCQRQPTGPGAVPKPGTGLILDLGKPTALGGIGFDGDRGTVEIWAADPSVLSLPPVLPSAPPAGFKKVATMPETPGSTKFPKFTTTTRYLLVWYTSLPAAPTPAPGITCHTGSSTTYQGRIDSLVVFRG